jgi:protocatechuate 3,4-dioxygenase beta subunit
VLVPSQRIVALFRALTGGTPADPRRKADWVGRIVVALAVAVCMLFTATLRDSAPVELVAFGVAVQPGRTGDGSIEARVTDTEGHPLEGAVVRAFVVDADGQVFFAGEGRSGPDGQVPAFEALPRGEAWLVAYARARARASTRVLVGGVRRSVTLAMREGRALAARVVDDAGDPVEGATVRVQTTDPLPHVIVTGKDGAATFERLGAPPWSVMASADGYDPISRSGVYPTEAPLELRLDKLGGFEVTVVDDQGTPEPFAEVLISGPGIWPARTTMTDGAGVVLISGLFAGVYDLKARLGDRISRTDFSVPLPRGKVIERTLTLEEGRYVTVHVTDGPAPKEGVLAPPVEGADVVLVEEGLSAFPVEAKSGKDGVALLGPITEGVATVSARADGFVPRIVGADAISDGEVTVPLLRGGTILGDVRDDRGFPVDGATIEVFGTDLDGMPIHESTDRSSFRDDLFDFALSGPVPLIPRGELGFMPGPIPPIPRASDVFGTGAPSAGDPWVTGADGTFRAGPIAPGRVQLLVRHPEYTETLSDIVPLASGGEAEVHIVLQRGGRLEGRVLEEDRLPVAGARIELAAIEGTFESVTYTADDGTFAVASVPKQLLVTVMRPETPTEIAERLVVDVPPGERAEIEIVLPKAREPSMFRVVDDRGYPLSRVEVRVTSLDVATSFARTFFTDDDGQAEVPGVVGLPLRVVLERPGQAPLAETVDAAAKEQQFVMQRSRTLKGSVTARDGRDRIEGADVSLYTDQGARHVTTEEYGDFVVEDLAEGRIRIVVRHEGHAPAEKVLWFSGDERRPIEIEPIDLVPAGSVDGTVVGPDESPVAGARVGHGGVPTYLPVGMLPAGLVQTDANGRFTLGGLPEGKVRLEAYSPELGRGSVDDVEIRADRTTDRVVIQIPEQDYDPKKLRGAGSIALTLAEKSGAVLVLDVPEGGEAEVAGVEPGDALVSVGGVAVGSIERAREALSGPLAQDVVVELSRELPKGGTSRLRLRLRREVVRR